MTNESLKTNETGLNEAGVQRMPYHSPKFVSLGPIQTLVQSSATPPSGDGGNVIDGTGS